MNDLLNPPAIVQSIVTNYERVGELIRESRAVDEMLGTDLRSAAERVKDRGQLLLKAQQMTEKGKWRQRLKENWPELNERTARRYISLATADNLSALRSHTNLQLIDKDEPEESSEPEVKPLTLQERKVLVSLIASVKPGLGKKLRDGTKKFTDDQLKAAAPVSCGKCSRLGWAGGKPCENCETLRKGRQQEMFEEGQEPADPNDPASAPAPPPDELGELKSVVAKAKTMLTKMVRENPELYRAFVACSLVDHVPNGPIKVLPFEGVSKIIELVKQDEGLSDEKIKQAYQGACGTWVPEYVRHARAKKARRENK